MKICPRCQGSFEEGIAYCPKDGTRLTSPSKFASSNTGPPGAPSSPPPPADRDYEDLTGKTVAGRYKIRSRLGEGGMGVVYSAIDERLEKPVAIKVLKEDFARRTDVVARFTQEAKSAARIKHENVLDVTDYGQTEAGSFYIAMEMLVGTDLADVLQSKGTIEPARAVAIGIQVCRALGAAHTKGIVHRDMKPENIFLVKADDGREVVKIVDFGIAQMKDLSGGGGSEGGRKLTRTGMIFGTPEYMSPEQAAGKSIDHRVDIYATGVILYEMLAGRVPFVGDTFMGVLTQHMFENPPPIKSLRPDANVPPELEQVIHRALAKDPVHRYASMQQLMDDLIAVRDGALPTASTSQVPPLPSRPSSIGGVGTAGVGPISDPGVAESVAPRTGRSRTAVIALGAVGMLAAVAAGFAFAKSGATGGTTTATTTPGSAGATTAGNAGAGAGGAGTGAGAGTPSTPLSAAGAGADASTGQGAGTTQGTGATQLGVLPAPVAADAAVQPVAASTVRVHIVTTPVPGRVEVEGQPALTCAATPCDITFTRGTQVRVRATAPRKRGELVFIPDRDGQEISIALASTGGGGGGGGSARPSGGSTNARAGRCQPGQTTRIDPVTGLRVPCVFEH